MDTITSNSSSSGDSSFLMWALGAFIVGLAAHVMLGWIRQAQSSEGAGRWGSLVVGAFAFATAACMGFVLGLAGEALPFPLGYRTSLAVGSWLAAFFAVVLITAIPASRPGILAALFTGVLMALVTTALPMGWLLSVGFRPGIVWRPAFLTAALVVGAVGNITAFALGFPRNPKAARYRHSWRVAAAALVTLSTLACFALVMTAAGMGTQVGSVYRYEISATALTLLGGGLLPLVLIMMTVDIEQRRRQRRRLLRRRRRDAQMSTFADGVTGFGPTVFPEDFTEAALAPAVSPAAPAVSPAPRPGGMLAEADAMRAAPRAGEHR